MATVDQSRVTSGFDAEALLGERYLQMILATAFDAGIIPSKTMGDTTWIPGMIAQEFRLYTPEKDDEGFDRPAHEDAYQTEILFDRTDGANVRVRAMLGDKGKNRAHIDIDIFAEVALKKEFDPETGALAFVGLTVRVVDLESSLMTFILTEASMTEDELLAKVRAAVDRPDDNPLELGGASKFKQVEDLDIKWHRGDANHPSCLGLYINLRIRNGDPVDAYLPPRGDLRKARNFLPNGEDIAMATRPGMYEDMAKHVYSSTAIEDPDTGNFDHALRKSLFNPDSDRLGDLFSVQVGRTPSAQVASTSPVGGVPQNGMRITVNGDYHDPTGATNTNTNLTITLDLRPDLEDDGGLGWDTDFYVDIDAVWEPATLLAAGILLLVAGPWTAAGFLGVVWLGELVVGVGISWWKGESVQDKADATLTDVIPDRLTISTRRWDPFYATLHQVVTKPSQAEFNDKGFLMCGKAFVGRQLVPPTDMYIRDEMRDRTGAVIGMRYHVSDHEKVVEESQMLAPGTHRRRFTPASIYEPDLWPLSLNRFEQRVEDNDGPLILANIPYFQAYVYIREHQIDKILCISGTEVEALQKKIRREARSQAYEGIKARDGATITQEVADDLPNATDEERAAEVESRINKKVKKAMDKYRSPNPLRLARDGSLEPLLRFDLAPDELVMLQDKGVLRVDSGNLQTIHAKKVMDYLRDAARYGDEEEDDNLMQRPTYKPTKAGPVFR